MAESPHLWEDFVSSYQTYRQLRDLKERVSHGVRNTK